LTTTPIALLKATLISASLGNELKSKTKTMACKKTILSPLKGTKLKKFTYTRYAKGISNKGASPI
jgi:hypothetical protein